VSEVAASSSLTTVQEVLNPLDTEECNWALSYMPSCTFLYVFNTICRMYWYRLQIKWDCKKKIVFMA
jgi:hypothetical protein